MAGSNGARLHAALIGAATYTGCPSPHREPSTPWTNSYPKWTWPAI